MKLFWKIYLAVLISFTVVLALIVYAVSTTQVENAKHNIIDEYVAIGSFIVEDIEYEHKQAETEWPLKMLSKLATDDDFLFWWIVKSNGTIYLADKNALVDYNANAYFPQLSAASLKTEKVFINHKQSNGVFIMPFNAKGENWTLWLGFSTRSVLEIGKKVVFTATMYASALLMLFGFVLYVLIKCLFRPIKQLANSADAIGKGNLTHRVAVKTKDELGQLAVSFNKMAADLQASTTSIDKLYKEITDRRFAEARLKTSEQKLTNLIEAMSDWVWEVNKNGIYTYVGPRIKNLIGYEANEVLGKTPFDFMPKEEAEKIGKIFAELKTRKASIHNLENVNRHKDGRLIVFETNAIPILDEDGHLQGYRGIDRDITERKQAEQTLTLQATMLDATPGFVGFADAKDTHILYINPAGRKMVGIGAQEDVTKFKIADVHPEQTNKLFRDEAIPTAIRDGIWTGECAFLNRDSHEIPVMMVLLAHKSPSGEVERFSTISIDITEQKRAAEAMRDSEALYKTLYDSSQDAIMLIAPPSWKFFAANTATIALFGAKDEAEFYSFPPWTLSPEYQPDGQLSSEKAKSMIEKAMKEGSNFFEWQHKRVDGKEFTATVLLNSLVLKGNKVVQATVKDISEQKLAEQRLKENESRLAVLFEVNPTGLVLIERASRKVVQANAAAAKMIGLPIEKILGQVCHGFMCPAERDHCPICDLGQQVDRSERILLTANGSRLPILKTVEKLMLGDKEYLLESFIDITERKEAERLLRESEETYRKQFEGAMDAIFVADPQSGILLDCNDAALKLVGRERSEVIGKSHAILHPPEEIEGEFNRSFKEHLPNNEERILETKIVTKNGEIKDVAIKPSLLEIKGKQVLQGIFRDITERKKAEKALEQLNEDLKATIEKLTAANRELREFAHIIAHDLKTPLRAIGTLTEWLVTDYANKFDDEGKELAHLLTNRAERMDEQISSILKYSEIGCAKGEKAEIDLNGLIKDVTDSITPPENIKVIIDGKLPTIMCEKIRITQIFQNLISNAVKYIDKPTGLITISCAEDDAFWKFSVADNGRGIEEKYFGEIFKIFQTLAEDDENKGIGMGLAIVKKTVELYGGRVWVESKVGQGSTFLFTLPKQKQSQETLSNG